MSAATFTNGQIIKYIMFKSFVQNQPLNPTSMRCHPVKPSSKANVRVGVTPSKSLFVQKLLSNTHCGSVENGVASYIANSADGHHPLDDNVIILPFGSTRYIQMQKWHSLAEQVLNNRKILKIGEHFIKLIQSMEKLFFFAPHC